MFGIDVSANNGKIDWSKVAKNNQKVDFAYIKASEGVGYMDAQLKTNATNAKANNIKIGYYHFCTLNKPTDVINDATTEAEYFLSCIKDLPAYDMPLVLDIETNKSLLTKAQVSQYIITFFDILKKKGHKKYVIYSYTPFLNSNLPLNHEFGKIPLWIAAYTTTLKLPKGWTKEWIWQYSCTGSISGIKGNVDLNKG